MIKAIETRYAGCRFRSRLEARWATFFDHLGIEWEYEPERFEVGPEHDRRRYLPDFWLPKPGLWVEVKGQLALTEQRTLFYASIPGLGLPRVADYGLLMLGDIPRVEPGWACWHFALRRCEHDGHGPGPSLCTNRVWFDGSALRSAWSDYYGAHIADPDEPNPSGWAFQASVTDEPLIFGHRWGASAPVAAAYAAARSARFEHGESGAPRRRSRFDRRSSRAGSRPW